MKQNEIYKKLHEKRLKRERRNLSKEISLISERVKNKKNIAELAKAEVRMKETFKESPQIKSYFKKRT